MGMTYSTLIQYYKNQLNLFTEHNVPVYISDKFIDLVYCFSKDNQEWFRSLLGHVFTNEETSWLIRDSEEEKETKVSKELLDLLDGYVLTYYETPPKHDNEIIRWCIVPILFG